MKNSQEKAGLFNDTTIAEVLIAEYKAQGKHTIKFPVYINSSMIETDIDVLDLNHRSYNCLRRPGITTLYQLLESVETVNDLLRYRGLGTKSASEIMYKIYLYQYTILPPEKREQNIKDVIEMNKDCNA